MTPAQIRKLFNMPTDLAAKESHGKQMIWSAGHARYELSDLNQFTKTYFPPANGAKIENVGSLGDKVTLEDQLDVQMIVAYGTGISTSHFTKGSFAQCAAWLSDQAKPPWVVSFSYGSTESTGWTKTDAAFQKAGLRGITLVAASGDHGPGCSDDGSKFQAIVPGSGQFILSAGGINGHGVSPTADGPHGGWGGGFSWVSKRAPFQEAAVQKYFQTAKSFPKQKFWNRAGRAYPDIVSQACEIQMINKGHSAQGGGTSAASPVLAGLISMMNNMRADKGMKPLGYVNQLLYKIHAEDPDAFIDVIRGSNADPRSCDGEGFDAVKGWDPATGLGLPNWPKLLPHMLGQSPCLSPQAPQTEVVV